MAAKKVTKFKAANVSAMVYDGEFSVSYDCVGENQCSLAIFFCDPHNDDDECTKKRGLQCAHPRAVRSALEILRDKISDELKQFDAE